MRAFSSLYHITGFSGLLSNLNGFGPTFTNESLSTFSSTTLWRHKREPEVVHRTPAF